MEGGNPARGIEKTLGPNYTVIYLPKKPEEMSSQEAKKVFEEYFEDLSRELSFHHKISEVSDGNPGVKIFRILGGYELARGGVKKEEAKSRVSEILYNLSTSEEKMPIGVYLAVASDREAEVVEEAVKYLNRAYRRREGYGDSIHKVASAISKILSGIGMKKRAERIMAKVEGKGYLRRAADYTAELLVELAEKYF